MQLQHNSPSAKAVLNKAVYRASAHLGISITELSKIIGISKSQLSRLFNKNTACINEGTKEWECAVLLLRIIRSLEAIVGDNPQQANEWLRNYNYHLGGTPMEMLVSIQGLISVVEYLDAMRGQY